MRMAFDRLLMTALALACMVCTELPVRAEPIYRLTALGFLPGYGVSNAFDINNRGQVVGNSYNNEANVRRAFLWEAGPGMVDLGDLPGGGDYSAAYAINDTGWVVVMRNAAEGPRAFLWRATLGMKDLGVLTNASNSYAFGIDDAGRVVGRSDATAGPRAFIWQIDEGMTDLGPGSARAINNSGQIVGENGKPFLWDPVTGVMDLGDLPGFAWDINDSGQVVGQSGDHAFLYDKISGMLDLGMLNASTSAAYGINKFGQVVGSLAPWHDRAFVWSRATGMRDFNDLVDSSAQG